MPKYIWGTSPDEHSLFTVRTSPYWRQSAVCFHCRTSVRTYRDVAGVDVFNEHFDVDRDRRNRNGSRRIGIAQENEICPGSDYPPIPLAYKFEDGSPIPRY